MAYILIIARTKWESRKAVRPLDETFSELNLEKHPDKTLIGRLRMGLIFWVIIFDQAILSLQKRPLKFLCSCGLAF